LTAAAPLLEVRGVNKSFGASKALRGVSFDLAAGEVHALLGENGAGKSTLMKVLSGAVRPDGGTMALGGEPYAPRSPRDARDAGLAMIYQELALATHLSVEANVMLGRERTAWGLIRRGEHRRRVAAALERLGHPELRPGTPVAALGSGARQLVEVARALVADARVIIFDEPTSSLSRHDADRLFQVIARLKGQGIAVVYISHFLEEVRQVAGRYTVLRDGRTVGAGSLAGVGLPALIRLMVGRDPGETFPKVAREPGETVLELEGLRAGGPVPVSADLRLRRGEILGVAGLIGSGRTELLRAVYGLGPVAAGRVVVRGVGDGGAAPSRRVRGGMGLLSEDRKSEGLASGRSIEDNATYPALGRHARFGWLDLPGRRREVEALIARVGVKCAGPWQAVGALSGGNQQKVALARLLHQRADVLLLDEPTRGIDVGAKVEVYRLIGELAAAGAAVLMVSSDLPELLGVCDRLAVMCRGRLTAARPVSEWDADAVLAASTTS